MWMGTSGSHRWYKQHGNIREKAWGREISAVKVVAWGRKSSEKWELVTHVLQAQHFVDSGRPGENYALYACISIYILIYTKILLVMTRVSQRLIKAQWSEYWAKSPQSNTYVEIITTTAAIWVKQRCQIAQTIFAKRRRAKKNIRRHTLT